MSVDVGVDNRVSIQYEVDSKWATEREPSPF